MVRTKYRTIVQSFNVHAICISRDNFCCYCCCCKIQAIFICSKIIVCEPHFFALFSQDKQNWIQNLNMLCTFRLVWRKNRFGLLWERSHIYHIFSWNAYRFVDGAFNTFVVLLSSCLNFFITMTNQETNKLHTCMRIYAPLCKWQMSFFFYVIWKMKHQLKSRFVASDLAVCALLLMFSK